jgi:hypothetical protein
MPCEPLPKGEADRAPVAVGATSLNGSPDPCRQVPQSVTGAHDIVTAISAAGGGATVKR